MKTKQFYFGMLIAFVAMMFTACSSSDETQNEHGTQLRLSAGITAQKEPYNINEWGTSVDIGNVDASFAKESQFKVDTATMTRTPADDSNWAGMNNRNIAVQVAGNVYKYSVDESGDLTSNTPYYFTTLDNLNIVSWYPYSASLGTFAVNTNQSTYGNYEASDLIYGTTSVSHTSANNTIAYAHKTAKIKIAITVNNNNRLLNKNITAVSLTGTKPNATVSNGNLTATGSAAAINMYNNVASSANGTTSTATFEASIIPQTAALSYTISYGGRTYSGSVSSRTYSANNIYLLTMTLNVITINGHEWVDLGLPSGIKWATMNIGANNDYNYGDYYQWGAKDVYANTYSTNNYNMGFTNITPTSGYDVVRNSWGVTWRMPTRTECDELYNKCTWVSTTKNSINGMLGTSKINGNTIFLPKSGYLSSGNGSNVGSACEYWTSIVNTSNKENACSFRFISPTDYACTTDGTRRLGKSIRPVSD